MTCAALRLAGALCAAGALACGSGGGEGAPGAGSEAPRLVLVSIDSLRADRLGCYGAERDTSPAIDALCARGVHFAHAVAPTSWTLPSHVTLLSGLPIPAHRVTEPHQRIDPARQLLAEHLGRMGYGTAGFVSAPFLRRFYGFHRGFETWANFESGAESELPPDRAAHAGSHADETAPQVIDAALAWLAGRPEGAGAPWFLFVHLWDVHYDFLPPPPYDTLFDPGYEGDLDPTDFEHNPAIVDGMPARDLEHLRALYDGEIRWLDSHLGRLLEVLEARSARERIVIALVSDHGDEFFEHGKKGHFRQLYEESVRVPWILVDPGQVPAGVRVDAVVGLDDVAPTLLGLAGLPPLPEATGRDLSAALREGRVPSEPKLLELRQLRALRGPGWKVVHDGHSGYASYYDLEADPGEQSPQPARTRAPERLEELERREAEARRHGDALPWRGQPAGELDPGIAERLRELGYVE